MHVLKNQTSAFPYHNISRGFINTLLFLGLPKGKSSFHIIFPFPGEALPLLASSVFKNALSLVILRRDKIGRSSPI